MTEQQGAPRVQSRDDRSREENLKGTETKASTKTTELIFYVLAVLGVLIASLLVNGAEGDPDPFGAEQAWRYITYLTIGYLIARGLAKSGSREPYRD